MHPKAIEVIPGKSPRHTQDAFTFGRPIQKNSQSGKEEARLSGIFFFWGTIRREHFSFGHPLGKGHSNINKPFFVTLPMQLFNSASSSIAASMIGQRSKPIFKPYNTG
ncbi:hypothetical protein [Acetobacter sp. LMG 32666]|uniref:hypothetical protein n=1 Tax=Acetobacter sp. LMG 32666 TaxID=2959295 RepID=UPI0030C7EF70